MHKCITELRIDELRIEWPVIQPEPKFPNQNVPHLAEFTVPLLNVSFLHVSPNGSSPFERPPGSAGEAVEV